MKSQNKTYLVFIEQCDGDTLIKRMSGEEIRHDCLENGQEGIAIVYGELLKGFDNKTDITKL